MGQHVSKICGRSEMFLKVGRCLSREGLFPMRWHQWNRTGWNIRVRYVPCSSWEEQLQQEGGEKSPVQSGRQFISLFNSDLRVQTLIASHYKTWMRMQFGWAVQSWSMSSRTQTSKRMSYQQVFHPTNAQRALSYHFFISSNSTRCC